MGVPLLQIDAFADQAFRGNPAAVCLLDAPRDAAWMQAVAAEMNLAETAFVEPAVEGFGLRWFTPTVEVDLCGHATLASAHALWETGRLAHGTAARFHSRSGLLTATQQDGLIELDFPATPASESPAFLPGLGAALGATPEWTGRSVFDLMAVYPNAADVRALRPDMALIAELPARGVIATAPGDDGRHDFVSRFFGPAAGVPEDPVTGSAHCALSPYWSARLGRSRLLGYQASTRGGTVRVDLAGDRVRLGGHAVTVLRGELVA
ncbi:MAG: PhzF family phenazine biosynthesis protein [Gemmatimonadales bacterium]|nr:PhzF family phenazine biosynthesis protein [Gemmatimonadales bacterium]